MNPLTPRKIAQLRRIAEDAADNREGAVIAANDLHDLLDRSNNARSWKQTSEEWQTTAEEWEKRARAAEQPRPLATDDITDEMIERGRSAYWGPTYGGNVNERVRAILTAALAPARPEGAEKVEAVLNQYWSGDIDGTDLAALIVEEMNR